MSPSHRRRVRGGAAVARGEAGCLFKPALLCKGDTVRDRNAVSKMSLKESSDEEFAATQRLRDVVAHIPHSQKYFVVPLMQCTPAPLDADDLAGVDRSCSGQRGPLRVPQASLNHNRRDYRIIQMADGGIDFFRAAENARQDWSLPAVLTAMCDLLENGIAPLNAAGVLHFDIKNDNVVFDGRHVRLIDWDHAVFIDDFINDPPANSSMRTRFTTMIGKPVSYGFHDSGFFKLVRDYEHEPNGVFADRIMSKVSRLHEDAENDLAESCKVRLNHSFLRTQVLSMLREFRQRLPDRTWGWDRERYVELLQRNYDVYGWCTLMLDILLDSEELFLPDDVDRLFDSGVLDQLTAGLKQYVYSPFLLTLPFNISQLVHFVRKWIKSVFPPPKRRRHGK
jgi:hypothetical protein